MERYNKTLAIENEASTMVGNGRVLARFLSDLDSDRVGAMWDPANDIFDTAGEIPYPDGYEAIKDRMPHMHLKDAHLNAETGEPECTPIGDGAVDMPGQLQALIHDGYEGYVSLETHWRPQSLSEDQLNRPGGAAFSESGEFATRLCLDNWLVILKELGLRG